MQPETVTVATGITVGALAALAPTVAVLITSARELRASKTLKTDLMSEMQSVRSEMQTLRREMREDMRELRGDMNSLRNSVHEDMSALRERVTKVEMGGSA